MQIRKYKEIKIKSTIDSQIVKNTINELQTSGFESLEHCNLNPECNSISFIDPDFLVFQIKKGNNISTNEFKELYPENSKKDNIESNKLRRKAQILITIINKNLDLKNEFKKSQKHLKKPYCYDCGGLSSCCFK